MNLRFVLALLVVVAGACTTAKPKAERMMPPAENDANTTGKGAKDAHFDEVKKAAAEQLQCPVEQINIVCLRRDSDGECISVRADGCDKSYEYQFGDT